MKLRFLARAEFTVRELGVHRYYGRAFDAASREYAITREGCEFESGTPDADKCAKSCRKGELFAADEVTARAVGVDFVATEFKDGAHVVAAPKQAAKPAKEAS